MKAVVKTRRNKRGRTYINSTVNSPTGDSKLYCVRDIKREEIAKNMSSLT